jgi:8-oxo-dGTP diphosphatase
MARSYPEQPLVGVGALVWRDRQILLIRRGRAPSEGEWSIPGGGQELGETLFDAAIREVREETGVEVEPVGILTAVDSIERDGDGRVAWHYTIVDVECLWRSGEPAAGDDAAAVRWATPEEADSLVARPELRRVIRLAATQHARKPRGLPQIKSRPDLARLMRGPLGQAIARPWFDEFSLRVITDWVLPMARAWAAATDAQGDVARFADGIAQPASSLERHGWLPRTLAEMATLTDRHADATADWRRLLFSTTAPLADAVAAENARLDAATALNGAMLRFALFAHTRHLAACRWEIPEIATVEALHAGRLTAPDAAYALPAMLPAVAETRRLPSRLGLEHWLTFPSPAGAAPTPCWAHVFQPAEIAAGAATVLYLHGLGMAQDHYRAPMSEVDAFLRRGLRVVAIEASDHGRRRRPGRYDGEPLVASTPLGALNHLRASVWELATVTRWARRLGGPVGWCGFSLGALTAQLAAAHAAGWPADCRADALLLFTTSEGLDQLTLAGALGRAFGIDRALEERGWTAGQLRRWRPLTDPLSPPSMGAEAVFMVAGSEDRVTPFGGAMAIAERWGLAPDHLWIRRQGHFSIPAGLMLDEAPLDAFVAKLRG